MENYSFNSDAFYAERAAMGSKSFKYKINHIDPVERMLVLDIVNSKGHPEKNNQIVVSEADFKKYYRLI